MSNTRDARIERRKEETMKVLAVNSSPRGDGQSKTELMLNHLVKGMREAGAEVEELEKLKKRAERKRHLIAG